MSESRKDRIRKLQRNLQSLNDEEDRAQRQQKLKSENALQEKNGVNYYRSSDYAGLSCEQYQFYYGYESTFCKEHGNDARCDCETVDWCFTVSLKNGDEVMRIPATDLVIDHSNVVECLMCGIGVFINRKLQE